MTTNADAAPTTTYRFDGGFKTMIEERLDSLKQLAESPAMQKFVAKHEQDMETVVVVFERKRA